MNEKDEVTLAIGRFAMLASIVWVVTSSIIVIGSLMIGGCEDKALEELEKLRYNGSTFYWSENGLPEGEGENVGDWAIVRDKDGNFECYFYSPDRKWEAWSGKREWEPKLEWYEKPGTWI